MIREITPFMNKTGTFANEEPSRPGDTIKEHFDPNFGAEMTEISKSYMKLIKFDSKLGKVFDEMTLSQVS